MQRKFKLISLFSFLFPTQAKFWTDFLGRVTSIQPSDFFFFTYSILFRPDGKNQTKYFPPIFTFNMGLDLSIILWICRTKFVAQIDWINHRRRQEFYYLDFGWGTLIHFPGSVYKLIIFPVHFLILGRERSHCSPTLAAPLDKWFRSPDRKEGEYSPHRSGRKNKKKRRKKEK